MLIDRNMFQKYGWVKFAFDDALFDWVQAVLPQAVAATRAPEMQHWYQCQGTWFVGVDALDNDAQGNVGMSGPLRGKPIEAIQEMFGRMPSLHKAQVSVTYPGFPKPRDNEAESAFLYRFKRFGAHVDGLLAIGEERRRMVKEPHEFVLGIPLNACSPDASPLVVWEGSHKIMRAAFVRALSGFAQEEMANVDVTEAYKLARREVFETCTPRYVHAQPGEAYLMHRHCLHGVAPWAEGAVAPTEGRIIVYFRPETIKGVVDWLKAS